MSGSECLFLPLTDVVVFLDGDGEHVLLSNVWSRSYVETTLPGLSLIASCMRPRPISELIELISQKTEITWCDRTTFSNVQGLMADPSNLIRRDATDGTGTVCTRPEDILALLTQRHVLIRDWKDYLELFGRKRNMFDERHLGNFHQQLGFELRVKRRLDPDEWWVRQKFIGSGEEVRPNLYRFIQLHFWETYCREHPMQGQRVLDLGCGPGFYSRLFARQGAHVVGIDPNKTFIDLAIQQAAHEHLTVEFKAMDVGSGEALTMLPSDQWDLIVFQDTFLFYFVPHDERTSNDRHRVLVELKRMLKPTGRLVLIEPHGVFWLSPWFGDPRRPFTILTEYATKCFGVTPTLSDLTQAFEEAGWLIRRVRELVPSPGAEAGDPRAAGFARQFPLWWCFELSKS